MVNIIIFNRGSISNRHYLFVKLNISIYNPAVNNQGVAVFYEISGGEIMRNFKKVVNRIRSWAIQP
jgi:hypothetical protein